MENYLLNIKVRHEIIVVPMRDYIESWLKNVLIKITKPDQEVVVTTSRGIPTKENTKGTSKSKYDER
jgi:hypothetical protein